MFKSIAGIALVSLMGHALLAAEPTSAAAPSKIRVLLVTGGHGFEAEPFFAMFDGHPDIVTQRVEQPEASKWFAPDKADEYDVMVWYDWWQEISEATKSNLVGLLNKGKPLVVLHHSVCNYQTWPEGIKIIGGRYGEPDTPHPPSSYHPGNKFKIHIVDPQHPITKSMEDFEVTDETYNNVEVLPHVKPLITTEHPQSNKVIGWTHTYGNSPVAYIQPGHGPEIFADKNYKQLIVGAIRWAAGALPKPAEPAQAPAIPRASKIRALIVTGGHDFEREPFLAMFDGHPDITWKEVKQPEAVQWFALEKAGEYDLMVWYDFWKEISEEAQNNLVALLKKGKPLVVLHHALVDYPKWPEAGNIIGGRWVKDVSTFKHDTAFKIKMADPNHPITRFMSDFDVVDETYKGIQMLPHVRPLLSTDHETSDKVIGWTHTYGASPVAFIQPGHGPAIFADKNYKRLVIQSIRWAAGALPDTSDEGFVQLYGGHNLKGFQVMGDQKGFVIGQGGVLRSEAGTGGNWLRSEKEFGDFILRVEWRVSENGNSGVFIRAAKDGSPWVTGYEVQISNEPRDLAHCTGSLYGYVPVDPRPDESAENWHEFQIECRGSRIKVFADNIPVVDVDEKSVPALSGKPSRGYIGVQDAHCEKGYVEYRKIAIKELKMEDEPAKTQTAVWQLGTQAYTFRLFTLFEAIDKARSLGLKYIEAYPGQKLSAETGEMQFDHHVPTEVQQRVLKKLNEASVKLIAYGVIKFSENEKECRAVFDFCKAMGVETITAEPDPKALDLLDQLTVEYQINVAIHNHPKPSRYWNPQTVLDAIKGRNPRIGACADTGHWGRSGVDAVEALKLLEERIISLHFKDLNKLGSGAHDTVWGTGSSNAKGMLTELHRQGFSGVFSIEYEHNWENSMPEIAECIQFFKKTASELGIKVD